MGSDAKSDLVAVNRITRRRDATQPYKSTCG